MAIETPFINVAFNLCEGFVIQFPFPSTRFKSTSS
jgi:hypothetical protein